jgi:hypothetical protein
MFLVKQQDMRASVKKLRRQYETSSTSILIVSILMLSFIGASLYVMAQGLKMF